jgi:hypothetical protein
MELIDKETLEKVENYILEFAELIKDENYILHNKLISNWHLIEKLFLDFDVNYSWPMLKRHFARTFGFKEKNINSILDRLRMKKILVKGVDYVVDRRGPGATYQILESGAKKILEEKDSIEGAKYLFKKYGIEKKLKPNFVILKIIFYSVEGIDDPIKEYNTINSRKIDLYLNNKKLAIECDEHGHESESFEQQSNRQTAIEEKLKCEFLRFDPYPRGEDFDIGLIIKVILHYLFDKLIDGKKPLDYFYEKRPIKKSKFFVKVDLEDF